MENPMIRSFSGREAWRLPRTSDLDRNSNWQLVRRSHCLVAAASLLLLACGVGTDKNSPSARPGETVAYDVTRYTPQQFAILRWIEGDWRGELPKGGYFYER